MEIVGYYNDILEENDGELQFTGTNESGAIFKYVTPKVPFPNPLLLILRQTLTMPMFMEFATRQMYKGLDYGTKRAYNLLTPLILLP